MKTRVTCFAMENDKVKLTVDKRSGALTSFVIKDRKMNVLGGETGYVAVEDGLKNLVFDHRTPSKILTLKPSKEKDKTVFVLERRYENTDFTVREEITVTPEEISWNAKVSLEKGAPRTVQVYYVFPALKEDTHLFVAHSSAPLAPEQLDHRMYVYGGDQFRGELGDAVLLPLVTLYHPKDDYGISICHSMGGPKPQVQYFFARPRKDMSCVIKYAFLRLAAKSPACVDLSLAYHAGDWRCGLKYIKDKRPEYFQVEGAGIYRSEGAMLCSSILHADKEIKSWKKDGFRWQEIHSYVYPKSHFCVPEESPWDDITQTAVNIRNLTLRGLSGISLFDFNHVLLNKPPAPRRSYKKIRDYIRLLHKNGVASFLYVNPCLAIIEYAEEFADSIARKEDGHPFAGYYLGYTMNPDPKFSWGKNIIKQVKRLLDIFPEADGIFFDELHYRNFDFAHSDGVTMIHNRPCYCLGLGVEKLAEEVCGIVHQKGKAVWANGPTSLEVVKHVDGFMAEGAHWGWLGSVQYLGLAKLLVALQQVRDPRDHERTLKHCLIAGSQPSVPWRLEGEKGIVGESKETRKVVPDTRKEINTLFSRYQPLLEQIKGREWVLEPHALHLPRGLKGNIFKIGDKYAVTAVSMDKSIFDDGPGEEKITLEIRLPESPQPKKALLFSPDAKDKEKVGFICRKDCIQINLLRHRTASLVLLG